MLYGLFSIILELPPTGEWKITTPDQDNTNVVNIVLSQAQSAAARLIQ